MHLFEYKEQAKFTFAELKETLGKEVDDVQVTSLLDKLELANCIEHTVPNADALDISTEKYRHGYYKFRFVGIINVENYCFFIYPKYWHSIESQQNKSEKFNTVLQVIRSYERAKRHNLGDSRENIDSTTLSTAITILQNYVLHGLYRNERTLIEVNGSGQILWQQTIEMSTAYIQKRTPLYLDVYTESKMLNEEDVLRRLHAAIISHIYDRLHQLLPYINIDGHFKLTNEQIDDIGPPDYLMYIIERELAQQFISDRQEVLRNMMKYIEGLYNATDETIQVYGTSSFQFVWEHVCSVVYENSLDKTMGDLGLVIDERFSESEQYRTDKRTWESFKLKDYVEKPAWTINGKTTLANSTLSLDVLKVDKLAKVFYIFDAKYYVIKEGSLKDGSFTITNQPGVGDVTKQYLYQLAYKQLAFKNGYTFSNNFVIPKDELEEETLANSLGRGQFLGRVHMEMLSRLGLEDITIIGRDGQEMFEAYLEKVQ